MVFSPPVSFFTGRFLQHQGELNQKKTRVRIKIINKEKAGKKQVSSGEGVFNGETIGIVVEIDIDGFPLLFPVRILAAHWFNS